MMILVHFELNYSKIGRIYFVPPEKHEYHAKNTCYFLQHDTNFGHKKEFLVTEDNCFKKKETYFKGKTTITGAIFLPQKWAKIILFSGILLFLWARSPCKISNHRIVPSGRKVNTREEEREKTPLIVVTMFCRQSPIATHTLCSDLLDSKFQCMVWLISGFERRRKNSNCS